MSTPQPSPLPAGPKVQGIVETCLYVDDLQRSHVFYHDMLGLPLHEATERMLSLMVAPRQLLLIFRRHASTQPIPVAGGLIPPNDGAGPTHLGLAANHADLDAWRHRLDAYQVKIESEVRWERGGHSLYFRDPDQNLVELLSPGVWPNY